MGFLDGLFFIAQVVAIGLTVCLLTAHFEWRRGYDAGFTDGVNSHD